MIKTVIFDLNKVLVTYDKLDDNYLKQLGISREEFWKNREEALNKYTLGEIGLDEFLLIQMRNADIDSKKLKIVRDLHNAGLRLVDGILPLVEDLEKKYKLILMAGEGKESVDLKIDKFDLRKHFSKIYASYISHMDKTKTEFYELILKENKLKSEDVLFIDDQQRYIDAAKKLGIKTIKFENSQQLKRELAKFN